MEQSVRVTNACGVFSAVVQRGGAGPLHRRVRVGHPSPPHAGEVH